MYVRAGVQFRTLSFQQDSEQNEEKHWEWPDCSGFSLDSWITSATMSTLGNVALAGRMRNLIWVTFGKHSDPRASS